jgi:hypothetical protein
MIEFITTFNFVLLSLIDQYALLHSVKDNVQRGSRRFLLFSVIWFVLLQIIRSVAVGGHA